MNQQGVLQCYRCGKSIDEGDVYTDCAMTVGCCPSHEDYLDWSPDYEEYFCEECGKAIRRFAKTPPVEVGNGGDTTGS